ncbi:MAG: hypothetical protein QOE90_18 [Thermoplasmata archaeon]|jgi:hypothetical protein|nr:hypothetical protein [Thermoplasmata archaeon]
MDRNAVAALLVALVFVASGLLYAYDRGSFREVARPDNGHKNAVWLAGAAIVLCLLAVPFAVMQGASAAAWRRELARIRDERPDAVVSDYRGEEGDGALVEDAQGRVLVLRAPGGIGAPRVVALPGAPLPSDEPAPDGAHALAMS